jgi:endonuclease/exonuclease/phosphatase family metal-dependent hydrolase
LLERHGWHVVPAGSGDSLGTHGNAILLAPSVDLVGWEGIDLPGLEPRGAVLAQLTAHGRPLAMGAAHLGLRRRDRRAQAAELVARLEDTGGPAILAGDLNEWSARRGLEPLAEAMALHAPGLSFHAARPIAALDRIALTPGLGARGGGVLQTAEARRASDHLPIWIDLVWPPDHVESSAGTAP